MFFDHHFIGMHWLWWIILTVILFLVLFNVIPYRSKSRLNEDALEVLKKRFARGEIEKEEYEERKRVITEGFD
jgi:putative membrane protein